MKKIDGEKKRKKRHKQRDIRKGIEITKHGEEERRKRKERHEQRERRKIIEITKQRERRKIIEITKQREEKRRKGKEILGSL